MRIQILELPREYVGEVSLTPFAIIIDQCDASGFTDDDGERAAWSSFRNDCGAKSIMVTEQTVEVVR